MSGDHGYVLECNGSDGGQFLFFVFVCSSSSSTGVRVQNVSLSLPVRLMYWNRSLSAQLSVSSVEIDIVSLLSSNQSGLRCRS